MPPSRPTGRKLDTTKLVLRTSKSNPRIKRWQSADSGEASAPAAHAEVEIDDKVSFRDGAHERRGTVTAVGGRGVSIVDESGKEHHVEHGDYHATEHPGAPDPEPEPERPAHGQRDQPKPKPKAKPKPQPSGEAESGGDEDEDEGRNWREEFEHLSGYPTKARPERTNKAGELVPAVPAVREEDVEIGDDSVDWTLRWPHPVTGTKQYGYDRAYKAAKDEKKFARMVSFEARIGELREAVTSDLALGAGHEDGALAFATALVDKTMIRAGNTNSEKKGVFGVSTLKRSHVSVIDDEVMISYMGKHDVPQIKTVTDPHMAAMARAMLDLPGEPGDRFIQALGPDGQPRPITAAKLSSYVRRHSGGTTKDFRTYHATRMWAAEADRIGPPGPDEDPDIKIAEAARVVAAALGHKKAKTRAHFVRSTTAGSAAAAREHGGVRAGGGMWAFHDAKARKAFEVATGGARVPKDQHPDMLPEHVLETSTSLANYIDPKVVEAYKAGLTLSQGRDLRKGYMSKDEMEFRHFLKRVDDADPYGYNTTTPPGDWE